MKRKSLNESMCHANESLQRFSIKGYNSLFAQMILTNQIDHSNIL
jgi:hypothetical protein